MMISIGSRFDPLRFMADAGEAGIGGVCWLNRCGT
jgi:hypothetical protein